MANIRQQSEFTFGGGSFQAKFNGNPIKAIREKFQQNATMVGNQMKRLMIEAIRERHETGEPGTGYSRQYAKRKTMYSPQSRSYKAGQPKDFEWSGQLHNALRGRLNMNKDRTEFSVFIGFRPNKRSPIQRSPGANPNNVRTLTNQNLARHLNAAHQGSQGAPFTLHPSERTEVLDKLADWIKS